MIVGALGSVPFEVSDYTVRTINNMQHSFSVSTTTHKPHLRNGLVEATGNDPDKLQFDIKLSTFLGVDPATELRNLEAYERRYATLPLVIGNRPIGRFRWLIQSMTVKSQRFDGRGHLIGCDVSLKLIEYLRW